MSEFTSNHGHDCGEGWEPADQPNQPADNCTDPDPPESPTDPKDLGPTPPTVEPCWTHSDKCKCPTKSDPPQHCLQGLLDEQVANIVLAEKSEDFKKVIEDLMKKSEAVRQDYTHDKYEKLIQEWRRQDKDIAELIRKLVCAVPCWKCVLDCHVCSLINDIYVAENELYDKGELYSDVHDLYDLQYWRTRYRDARQLDFDRIQKVMTAWEKPADTIGAVLTKNKGLIDQCNGVIGTEPGKAIYDVFFILVPLHLAIAPPAKDADTTTKIDKKYTQFCGCEIDPTDCCGPDVGPWSVRDRLVQPQPYLVDPNEYLTVFCCLVKRFYGPAKSKLNDAEIALADINGRIDRAKKRYEDGLKNFEKNAKAAIPSVIDCCDYKPDGESQQPKQEGYVHAD